MKSAIVNLQEGDDGYSLCNSQMKELCKESKFCYSYKLPKSQIFT